MTLQDVITERAALVAEVEQRRQDYDAAMAKAQARLAALKDAEKLIVFGLDHDKIERGRSVVVVRGKVLEACTGRHGDGAGVRLAVLTEAKADLAAGAVRLRAGYLGVKNYGGFGDQREDHRYGYGPRHGSIVFSIGMSRDLLAEGRELIPGEIDAGLYYLASLVKIEAALDEKVTS